MKTATSRDGTPIAYDAYGSGPALIYITGASCFRRMLPVVRDSKAFAKEFTVFSYDRRGRGDSGDTPPYSIEREVDDIEAVIDAAGGKAHVYGHSSGAALALEAALRLTGKVQKLVMYDPAYVHDDTERAEYARLSQQVEDLLRDGKHAQAMRTFLNGIGMPKTLVTLMPLLPGWRTMKALAPTLTYDIAITRDLPPTSRAANVPVPALILAGEKSPVGMRTVVDQLTEVIPDATSSILNGQDHLVSPRSLLPELVGFLKR